MEMYMQKAKPDIENKLKVYKRSLSMVEIKPWKKNN